MNTGFYSDDEVPASLRDGAMPAGDDRAYVIACTTYEAPDVPSEKSVKLVRSELEEKGRAAIGADVVDRHGNDTRAGTVIDVAVDAKNRLWAKYALDNTPIGLRLLRQAREGQLTGVSWQMGGREAEHPERGPLILGKNLQNLSMTEEPEWGNDSRIHYISADSGASQERRRLFELDHRIDEALDRAGKKQLDGRTSARSRTGTGNTQQSTMSDKVAATGTIPANAEQNNSAPTPAQPDKAVATPQPPAMGDGDDNDDDEVSKQMSAFKKMSEQLAAQSKRAKRSFDEAFVPPPPLNFHFNMPGAVPAQQNQSAASPNNAATSAAKATIQPPAKKKTMSDDNTATPSTPVFDDKVMADFLKFQEFQRKQAEAQETLQRQSQEQQLRARIAAEERAKLEAEFNARAAQDKKADPDADVEDKAVKFDADELTNNILKKLKDVLGLTQAQAAAAANKLSADEQAAAKADASNKSKPIDMEVETPGSATQTDQKAAAAMPPPAGDVDEEDVPEEGAPSLESDSDVYNYIGKIKQRRDALAERQQKFSQVKDTMPAQDRAKFTEMLARERDEIGEICKKFVRQASRVERAWNKQNGLTMKPMKKATYAELASRGILDDNSLNYIGSAMEFVTQSSALHERTLAAKEEEFKAKERQWRQKYEQQSMMLDELNESNASVSDTLSAFDAIFNSDPKAPSNSFVPTGFVGGRAAGHNRSSATGMEQDKDNAPGKRLGDNERPSESDFSKKHGIMWALADASKPPAEGVFRQAMPSGRRPTVNGRPLQHVKSLRGVQHKGMDASMRAAYDRARAEALQGPGYNFGDGESFFINKDRAYKFGQLPGATQRTTMNLQMLNDGNSYYKK